MENKIIDKKFVTFHYDKYGKLIDGGSVDKVHIEVEIKSPLSKMCQDLLALISEENVSSFSLTHVVTGWIDAKIKKTFFDLEYIDKIVFDEYYMMIDEVRILYNSIFDFNRAKRW